MSLIIQKILMFGMNANQETDSFLERVTICLENLEQKAQTVRFIECISIVRSAWILELKGWIDKE